MFDLALTREMLETMADATAGAPIRQLVNTHANGDHCWGNELVEGAEIIASTACRDEMVGDLQPDDLAALLETPGLGPGSEYAKARMGAFTFRGITLTPPTRTFDGELALDVGGRHVLLIEVGPAHTRGDVLAYLPEDKTVFTGDILFIDGTPIMWNGPVGNWIGACERMLEMDLDTVVPGHGPVTDKNGIRAVRDYLRYIESRAREFFDAGVSAADAAREITLGDYDSWGDPERIAVNVDTLYREFGGDDSPPNVLALLDLMAELDTVRRAR